MKKILIALVACMFIISVLPGIVGNVETNEQTFKARRYIENRDIIPVYTEYGLRNVPHTRGKPGVYVTITNPSEGDTVSGPITITIDSNDNPSISIDGNQVGTGLSYEWDTTTYSDGSHTIEASAKGHTDTVTVTVNNGGTNQPPVVTITNPNNGAIVADTVTITVYANDPEEGTLTADIYIDGSFVASTNSYDWDTTSYADGEHTIYAEATDSGNLTDSDSITVTVDNSGNPVSKYALVIGISDYRGRRNDLQYCDDDAIDWKNFLESEGYTVTELLDNNAKADNIVAEVDNLLALEDGNDHVVLTYSGHGSRQSGYGSCIISTDMTYITHGWFESKFSNADSPHIYFTFDACEIGDFQGLITTNRVGAFASNYESSYDGDSWMQNGAFTYYQMEGWNSYDNFEDDGTYAVNNYADWADAKGWDNDAFISDNYPGSMTP